MSAKDGDARADVAMVGGGAAGLSAAIALARFGRRIVVVDAGRPRNAPADGMHNVLGFDGVSPLEYLARGRAEFEKYGGLVIEDFAEGVSRADGFRLELRSGRIVTAPRLVVASGVRDVLPDVPGVRALWGRDVLHCPFCHGWEVRGQAIGILGTEPRSMHQARLFAELSDHVSYFTHTGPPVDAADADALRNVGVAVIDARVAELVTSDERLAGVRLFDGTVVALQALVITPDARPSSPILDALGVPLAESPAGYAADAMGATQVPGVWIAGNIAQPFATVVLAAAQGMTVASAITADILTARGRVA